MKANFGGILGAVGGLGGYEVLGVILGRCGLVIECECVVGS